MGPFELPRQRKRGWLRCLLCERRCVEFSADLALFAAILTAVAVITRVESRTGSWGRCGLSKTGVGRKDLPIL